SSSSPPLWLALAPAASPLLSRPLATAVVAEPYHHYPQYSYGYETWSPDPYALIDSDGTRRQVDYTADSINGFNAVVSKQPLAKAIVAAPAPVARVAAPVLQATVAAAPIVRTAPLAAHLASPYAATTVISGPSVARIAAPAPLIRTAPWAAPVVAAPAPWAALRQSYPLVNGIARLLNMSVYNIVLLQ
ncbi:hypothetical protein NQ318_010292, partial [Aromia moschata]